VLNMLSFCYPALTLSFMSWLPCLRDALLGLSCAQPRAHPLSTYTQGVRLLLLH
jgi:hypothetical protein